MRAGIYFFLNNHPSFNPRKFFSVNMEFQRCRFSAVFAGQETGSGGNI